MQKFIKDFWKKWIITSNYKYLNKEDRPIYDVLLCIKNNWKYDDPQRPKVKWDFYIMSEKEVKTVLSKNWIKNEFQEYLIKNTHKIADKIDINIPLHQLLFPKYTAPEKYVKLFKKLKQ